MTDSQACSCCTSPDYVLRSVRQCYREGHESLSGIDLTIGCGEHVVIAGANGSGKSTLLKLLDGLVFASSGDVTAFGAPLTELALEDPTFRREFRSRVGFVFQDADVQLFCSNAYDELAFGPLQLGLPESEVRERVAEVAKALRIEKLLDRAPYTLSGGEKKRVSIGAVMTMRPHVLLMDEPTNALDPRSQVWLLDVLADMKRAGNTVVVATHDLGIAEEIADRMIVLSEQHRVCADGTPAEVLAERDLLLEVNLIHEHAHRHGTAVHQHSHSHGHGHGHSDEGAVAMTMVTARFSTSGMHCQSCEARIKQELENIAGVASVVPDHKSAITTVTFDGDVVDEKRIEDAIREAGYEAELMV
jgi:cobalt/nickel transport system ATP-binding protein